MASVIFGRLPRDLLIWERETVSLQAESCYTTQQISEPRSKPIIIFIFTDISWRCIEPFVTVSHLKGLGVQATIPHRCSIAYLQPRKTAIEPLKDLVIDAGREHREKPQISRGRRQRLPTHTYQ
jgi:hypothetical protein